MAFDRPGAGKTHFLHEVKRSPIQILVVLMQHVHNLMCTSLMLFADWAVTIREWWRIVVYGGETALCGRQNPSDKWVPRGLEAGPPWDNRQRNSRTRICPSLCSHHHISSTISPPACSLPLPLPAVLKLKTAAWNTRLMKPCLELFLFLPAVQSRFISMEWSV